MKALSVYMHFDPISSGDGEYDCNLLVGQTVCHFKGQSIVMLAADRVHCCVCKCSVVVQ